MNRPVGRPAPRKTDRRQILPPPPKDERPVYTGPPRKITLTEGVTVKELGEKMEDVKGRDIIKALISRGIMATVNQTLDPQLAIEICKEFGYEASIQSFEEEVVEVQTTDQQARGPRLPRPRGHRHGPRRPRQDVAPRRHPRDLAWPPARRAASPSTSAPTTSTWATGRSSSSTPPATRPSPSCAPAGPRSRTWSCWWWPPTTA